MNQQSVRDLSSADVSDFFDRFPHYYLRLLSPLVSVLEMSLPKVVICGAARTPIGAIGGSLADFLPRQLALTAVKAAIAHANFAPNSPGISA